jgi:hypothetical protein
MESSSADLRVSGQMAAVGAWPRHATPNPSFGTLIGAVALAAAFLGILIGVVTTAAVTRSQLDGVVARIDDRRIKDEERRESREREFQRDLDAQRYRITSTEEKLKTVESNVAWTRVTLEAIAARLRVVVPVPR